MDDLISRGNQKAQLEKLSLTHWRKSLNLWYFFISLLNSDSVISWAPIPPFHTFNGLLKASSNACLQVQARFITLFKVVLKKAQLNLKKHLEFIQRSRQKIHMCFKKDRRNVIRITGCWHANIKASFGVKTETLWLCIKLATRSKKGLKEAGQGGIFISSTFWHHDKNNVSSW